jgi:uncharacterized iron-regulated membrane protein
VSELAHGNLDGAQIHVGDQVMVSAEVLRSALDEAMHTCWLEGRWEWMTKKMSLAAREAAAAAVERHHERIDPDEPVTTLRWWKE